MPNPPDAPHIKRHFNNHLTPKAHVNTGRLTNVNARNQTGDGSKNCGLCTAAGLANLSSNKNLWTSGMVAHVLGTKDDKEGVGDDVNVQIEKIKEFAEPMTGRASQTIGDKDTPVSGGVGKAFMKSFPSGTTFAVYISVPPEPGVSDGLSHWLNGIKRGDGIEYVDFQSDNQVRETLGIQAGQPDFGKPVINENPVLGITGETVVDPSMIVIAFPPT